MSQLTKQEAINILDEINSFVWVWEISEDIKKLKSFIINKVLDE